VPRAPQAASCASSVRSNSIPTSVGLKQNPAVMPGFVFLWLASHDGVWPGAGLSTTKLASVPKSWLVCFKMLIFAASKLLSGFCGDYYVQLEKVDLARRCRSSLVDRAHWLVPVCPCRE
jgi:hypothetical protein